MSNSVLESVGALMLDSALLDHDPIALADAYWACCAAKLPHHIQSSSTIERFRALAEIAQVSGSLAFLVLQQYVAMLHLGNEIDEKCGVALGHLRSPETQSLYITDDSEINGSIPWLTGLHVFERVVLGYQEGEEEVFFITSSQSRPEFRPSKPLRMIALSSTNTVQVQVKGLSPGVELSRQPLGTMQANDRQGVIWQTPLMLGCLMAGKDCLLESRVSIEQKNKIEEIVTSVSERLERGLLEGVTIESSLRLRSEVGSLAVRVARLAAMSCGGHAILAGHRTERLYREALVFSLMAQTPEIVKDAVEQELA